MKHSSILRIFLEEPPTTDVPTSKRVEYFERLAYAKQALKSLLDEPEPPGLRDEFAKAALTGFIAQTSAPIPDDIHLLIAEESYRFADEMLKAREK